MGSGNSGGPSGGTGSPAGGGHGTGGAPAIACDSLTSRRVRRLSLREYSNVVTDLLGASAGAMVTTALPAEPLVGGFDNQSTFLYISPSLQESISDLAAALATGANPATLAPCTTVAGSPACLQTFIRGFASQAYGRPLADDELARISGVASMGQDYATSVRLVVELVLQSPNTLYVSELGPPSAATATRKPVALTPYEIASQLSFLLAGSRPDATLLKAAETTLFATPADILAQAQRMLAAAPAKAAMTRFVVGWLDMAPISEAYKSADAFPELTPKVLAGMQQEFDQFVATQLDGGNGTVASFFTATSTNVPAALAPLYGADLLPTGLDPTHRRGVLSLAGLLTYHSNDSSSGPVQRGLLVRRQLLCQDIPPPPANAVTSNPVDPTDTTMTTRQKFAIHATDPSCSGCHSLFDPIGFGFEQMDGIGRFRTRENTLMVDSAGQLTRTDVDGAFEGPAQLSAMLARSTMVESCMVNHFFTFAQARPTTSADACVVDDWSTRFTQGGGHIKDLVLAAVGDPSFASRKDDR